MQTGIKNAPPPSIVLPHFGFAAIAFLILTVLMYFSSDSFIGHYFSPKLLAITHIATLGWASMIIFGSLYQLLPVILNTSLYSIRIAKITFLCFTTGITILVYSFWTFSVGTLIQVASTILFIGATLFLLNIILTAKKAETLTTQAEFIIASTIWFWVTVAVGALMAYNFNYVFLPKEHLYYLKLHAHIGIAGWFILLIIGISSKLIPMFLLSSVDNDIKLKYSFNLINISILGFTIDSLFFNGISRGVYYLLIAILGILFYISFIAIVYKKRARRGLDIGMKHSLIAILVILIPMVFGFLASTISDSSILLQVIIAYGVSIFLGFISLLILGQTYKTLPFIVWLEKYQHLSGKGKAPLPKELYSEKIAKYQLLFFLVGVFIMIIGVLFSMILLIKSASILLIITAILYNMNVYKILLHKPKMFSIIL